MSSERPEVRVRNTRPDDFDSIDRLSYKIYAAPWGRSQLRSHLDLFPEGQFVAVHAGTGRLVGMAASLILAWDDYEITDTWREFTDNGMFTNHDPAGRTLYGAEIMVDPEAQGQGIGSILYEARQALVERMGLLRIRAGSRLVGYHRYADQMDAATYVIKVINGELTDPTLSFQLHRGFHVLAVVPNYLPYDPESLGYAAVIEWINHHVAKPEDYAGRNPLFRPNPAGFRGA